MAQKSKRKRQATLRNWWMPLPFLIFPTLLFMTFAHWEALRLQNQYRRIELVTTERELRAEIGQLQDYDRVLNGIKVTEKKAAKKEWKRPGPNQLVVVRNDITVKSLENIRAFRLTFPKRGVPTRSVLLHVSYQDAVVANQTDMNSDLESQRERMAYDTEASE